MIESKAFRTFTGVALPIEKWAIKSESLINPHALNPRVSSYA